VRVSHPVFPRTTPPPEKIKMLKRTLILLLFFVTRASYAHAPTQELTVSTGTIAFRSDTPLELIRASSNAMKGVFNPEKKQFSFYVNIRSFKGFNSPMQKEHFNQNYLESDRFPRATFEGKIIEDIDMKKEGAYNVRAKGNLTIHGVDQERIIKCNLMIRNGVMNVQANFTVQLADHNISVPKVVHEKLATEIKVEVKADLVEK
jgi:polyisoprenoid-binding protein YceI